jgi:hypothetical protein
MSITTAQTPDEFLVSYEENMIEGNVAVKKQPPEIESFHLKRTIRVLSLFGS